MDKGYKVLIMKKGNNVGGLVDSEEIMLLNIDNGESSLIKNEFNSKGIGFLEELFEEYDPAIMFVSNVDEESRYQIEENGVKIIETGERNIRGLKEELFLY